MRRISQQPSSTQLPVTFDRSTQFLGPLGLHIFRSDITPVSTLDLDRNFNILARAVQSRLLGTDIAGPINVTGAINLDGALNVGGPINAPTGALTIATILAKGLETNSDGSGALGTAPNQLVWNAAGQFRTTGSATLPGGGGGATALSQLSDVSLPGVPAANQVLAWNGTYWTNQTIATGTALSTLADVQLNMVQGGQLLGYDGTAGKWINTPYPNLGRLLDVTIDNPQSNQILRYDAVSGMWTNQDPGGLNAPLNVSNMLVLNADGSGYIGPDASNNMSWNTAGDFTFNGNAAFAGGVSGVTLQGLSDVNLSLPIGNGQLLTWNAASSRWINQAPVPQGVTNISALTGATSGLALAPNPITATGSVAVDWNYVAGTQRANTFTQTNTFSGTNNFTGSGSIGTAPNQLLWTPTGLTITGTLGVPGAVRITPYPSGVFVRPGLTFSPNPITAIGQIGVDWSIVPALDVGNTWTQSNLFNSSLYSATSTSVGGLQTGAGWINYVATNASNYQHPTWRAGMDVSPLSGGNIARYWQIMADNTAPGAYNFLLSCDGSNGQMLLGYGGIPGSLIINGPLSATQLPSIQTLSDVGMMSALTAGQALTWNGTRWINATPTTSIAGMSDVSISNPQSGQALTWNGSLWTNATPVSTLAGLSDVALAAPAAGQWLRYTGSSWANAVLPASTAAVDAVPPVNPINGEFWFRTTDGTLSVWYTQNGGQWVSVGGGGGGSTVGGGSVSISPGAGITVSPNPLTQIGAIAVDWTQVAGVTRANTFTQPQTFSNGIAASGALSLGGPYANYNLFAADGSGNIGGGGMQWNAAGNFSVGGSITFNQAATFANNLASNENTILNSTSGLCAQLNTSSANGCYMTFMASGSPFGDIGASQNVISSGGLALTVSARGDQRVNLAANGSVALFVDGTGNVGMPRIPGTATTPNMAVSLPSGAVYYNTSARRFKDNIRTLPRERAREIIHRLRPVLFNSKCAVDDPRREFIGLIAEEVAEVCPEMVTYDEKGGPLSVMYDRLPVLMLAAM